MFHGNAVAAGPVPADLLAPFAPEDQQMIQQEAAAHPAFAAAVTDALSRPGGPQLVAQSARKAIANELDPKMYPESIGAWPVLRRMTDELSSSTASDVIAKVDNMSFSELVNAVEGIAAQKKAGGIGGLGQASSVGSTLSVVGGLASSLAQAGAAIYTSHVIATTTKQIAQIQAGVIIHTQNVQSEIARAQAAMATAQATINAQKIQEQQIQLQQQQLTLQQQQFAAQQAQQQPDQGAQQAVPDQSAVDTSISTSSTSPSVTPADQVPHGPMWQVSFINPSTGRGSAFTWNTQADAQAAAAASQNAGMTSVALTPIPATPGWTPPASVQLPPMPPMQSSPVTTLGPASPTTTPQAVVLTGPSAPAAPSLVVPLLVAGGAGAAALLAHHFLSDLPGGDYIGRFESEQFARLSKPVQQAIALEAEDPAFVTGYLIPVLRSPNPEAKILSDIAHEVHMADMYGMGYLGKSFWKKVVKAVKKVTISLPKKVFKWTTPKVVQKFVKKAGKPIMKVWHKFGPIIISVIGGVLAPFTFGMSAVAAAIIVAAKQMHDAKVTAAYALKAAKAGAGQQQAAADAAEAQVSAQVEQFFQQNQAWFTSIDITPASWAQLNLDQKIAIINAGATGTLPPGTVQIGSVSVPPSDSGISYGQPGWTPPAGYAVPTPPTSTGTSTTTSTAPNVTSPPVGQQIQQATQSGGGIQSTPGAPTSGSPTDVPMASSGGGGGGGGGSAYAGAESTDTGSAPGQAAAPISTAADQTSTASSPSGGSQAPATPPAPAGQYAVVVEGQTIATVGALPDATTAAISATKPGDRFEILLNGQTTGLRLRTSTGSIAVPAAQEAQVRALTHDQSVALVASAEQQAAGQAAAPAGGPSLLIPGIIAGALAIGAAVLGGRKH